MPSTGITIMFIDNYIKNWTYFSECIFYVKKKKKEIHRVDICHGAKMEGYSGVKVSEIEKT